jgi:hypothetical protein
VKKKSLVLAAVALFLSSFYFLSCKKINEATELGGELIPPIDNVNTFEISLETETDNFLMNDTTRLLYNDQIAIGHLSDPEFGETHGNGYFNIGASTYGTDPFLDKTTLAVDSVVLSLAYTGGYGDTNTSQTIRIFEVDPSADLSDTSFYKYTDDDLPTTGAELGSETFILSSLKDSTPIIRKDTQWVRNVVRIRLDNSIGTRFASYDTVTGPNGGFNNDSIFRTLFKGLAIKADASGNALAYFNVFDNDKTKLTVYYTATKDSKKDTLEVDFIHRSVSYLSFTHPAGVVNAVKRTPAGNWASYLANANPLDDKLYIQSSPGSYGLIKIPGLNTMDNKLVHLAELIVYRIPSALDNIYTPPSGLYLDRINNAQDSAFTFENDQPFINEGQIGYNGGNLKDDNTYRFNITRHVQGILTRKEQNQALRIYAPLRNILHVKNAPVANDKLNVPVLARIADGRVLVAGGNYSDPNLRLRLRLVYSNL